MYGGMCFKHSAIKNRAPDSFGNLYVLQCGYLHAQNYARAKIPLRDLSILLLKSSLPSFAPSFRSVSPECDLFSGFHLTHSILFNSLRISRMGRGSAILWLWRLFASILSLAF